MEPVLNAVMTHFHAKFQTIPYMCFPQNAKKPKLHPPEGQNCANTEQNRIISQNGQDKSTCHISGHFSFHAFSLVCPETQVWLRIKPILTIIKLLLEVVRIHQRATFQTISSMHFPWNDRKPNFTSFATRGPKFGQYWPESNHFGGWSGYSSMPQFGPLLLCVLLRMFENLSRRTDVRTDGR